MYHQVPSVWEGQDAFIIGGGLSLKTFDWNRLSGKNVIGCNAVFDLKGICDCIVFGDIAFFDKFYNQLKQSTCPVYTNYDIDRKRYPWLRIMRRDIHGLSIEPDCLAWNGSTGAAAINLAILLGVVRIYLLGYDMGGAHWHCHYDAPPAASVYPVLQKGFNRLQRALKEKRPDVRVINVNDDSALAGFEKVSVAKFWRDYENNT